MAFNVEDSMLRQHARNAVLIALSLALLPFSATVAFWAYCLAALRITSPRIIPVRRNGRPVRVLVTGIGMTKGLFLCRSFYLGGCHVVGVDFRQKANIPCGRMSKAISSYYSIASPSESVFQYEAEMMSIVRREQIDLCVTCSGVATAIEDAQVMERLAKSTGCKSFQLTEEAVGILDDKLKFMQLTDKIGLPNPKWHSLSSTEDVVRILAELRREAKQGPVPRYIVKSVDMDDASRGAIPILDFTRPDKAESVLKSLVGEKGRQWILQEYFPGDEEYGTHAVVVNGKVKTFLANPSASILLHYELLDPASRAYQDMLSFTERYASELHERSGACTGHLSFDFRVRETPGSPRKPPKLVPIECNPRCHTATVLMRGQEKELTKAYLSALDGGDQRADMLEVNLRQAGRFYWMAHDLVALVLAPLLNVSSLSEMLDQQVQGINHFLWWKDPVFEWWDPLPWFVLYHIYWPLELLSASLLGLKWKALNVSTTKMFIQ